MLPQDLGIDGLSTAGGLQPPHQLPLPPHPPSPSPLSFSPQLLFPFDPTPRSLSPLTPPPLSPLTTPPVTTPPLPRLDALPPQTSAPGAVPPSIPLRTCPQGARKEKNRRQKRSRATIIAAESLQPVDEDPQPAGDEEPSDSEADGRPRKRSNLWGIAREIQLGSRPRSFINLLTYRCQRLDLKELIKSLGSSSVVGVRLGASLGELTHQWYMHELDQRRSQFNQAAIEMEVFRRCQK